MINNVCIRKIKESEIDILEDLLYEAIFQPDDNNPILRSILQVPEVNAYIKDFGIREDDHCFVSSRTRVGKS